MDLSRLNHLKEMRIMQESKPQYWTQRGTPATRSFNLTNSSQIANQPQAHRGLSLSPPLSREEYTDILRCFRRANVRVEGYLDCDELKIFMDLRRCPITQWEAMKLLEYADSTYHYYISLDQVLELATLYGIATTHPVRMTQSEFEMAIKHTFSVALPYAQTYQSEDRRDINSCINFFETKATHERQEEQCEETMAAYQKALKANRDETQDQRFQEYISDQYDTSLQNQQLNDRSAIYEEPQEPVRLLTKKWEVKIHGLGGEHCANQNRESEPNPIQYPDQIDPVEIKSIYRRDNRQMPCLISESREMDASQKKSRTSETKAVQTDLDYLQKSVPHSHKSQNTDDLKNLKTGNENIAPPLPPPIVPDTPLEWISTSKVTSVKSKDGKTTEMIRTGVRSVKSKATSTNSRSRTQKFENL